MTMQNVCGFLYFVALTVFSVFIILFAFVDK